MQARRSFAENVPRRATSRVITVGLSKSDATASMLHAYDRGLWDGIASPQCYAMARLVSPPPCAALSQCQASSHHHQGGCG